ncbi:MAG: hypothetical protein DRP83_03150 [Planctomycetota bacterium]|nr:MAG: hypothetical protein DRP83_03150 [Planctomycetota bacterium]
MPKEEDLIGPAKGEEFVPVVFARSPQEAQRYRQLLEDHDVEAFVGYKAIEGWGEVNYDISEGTPILVSENSLADAEEIIADRDEQDEFITDGLGESLDEEDEYEDLSPTSEEDEIDTEDDVASLVEGLIDDHDDHEVAYTDEMDDEEY